MSDLAKGLRTISYIEIAPGRWRAALGELFDSNTREMLLKEYGETDRKCVADELALLDIGATPEDCEQLCYDLDTMRITTHRPLQEIDEVLNAISQIIPKLPIAIEQVYSTPPSGISSLNESASIAEHRAALTRLMRAAEKVHRTRVWLPEMLDWRDDAFLLAVYVRTISQRGKRHPPSFSSRGPAARFIAHLLDAANVRRYMKSRPDGCKVEPDTVKVALGDHPGRPSLDATTVH